MFNCKPSGFVGPLDASSKPGASSVVGARRPCPYFENTSSKEYKDYVREISMQCLTIRA